MITRWTIHWPDGHRTEYGSAESMLDAAHRAPNAVRIERRRDALGLPETTFRRLKGGAHPLAQRPRGFRPIGGAS